MPFGLKQLTFCRHGPPEKLKSFATTIANPSAKVRTRRPMHRPMTFWS